MAGPVLLLCMCCLTDGGSLSSICVTCQPPTLLALDCCALLCTLLLVCCDGHKRAWGMRPALWLKNSTHKFVTLVLCCACLCPSNP